MMVCISISIAQQTIFDEKIYLYDIYDLDKELKDHSRKAPKLSYQALHPGNNKQNVPLAFSIIHETTIAASKQS